MTAQASPSGIASAILKRMYDSYVNDGLNSRDEIMIRMPKEDNSDGVEFYKAHRTGGTNSIGAQAENATLPTPGSQSWKNSVVEPSEIWGTLSLTQRLISMTKTNMGSFMRGIDSEMVGFSNDWRRRLEIMLSCNGSGTLGVVSANPGAGATATLHERTMVRRFRKGDKIRAYADWLRDSNELAGGEYEVDSVNIDAKTVTFTGNLNAAVVANSVLVQSGSRGLGNNSVARYEFIGIDGAIDNRDTPMEDGGNSGSGFQQILAPNQAKVYGTAHSSQTPNGSGEPTWGSPVLHASGVNRPITERILQEACDAVHITGNGEVDVFVCPFSIRLDYATSQMNLRRNTNTNRIAGSTSGGFDEDVKAKDYVQYADLNVIPWRFCPENTIYAMSWGRQKLMFWARPQWWSDGNILRRDPDKKTNYMGEMFTMLAYCMEERNAHCRITDIEGTEIAA